MGPYCRHSLRYRRVSAPGCRRRRRNLSAPDQPNRRRPCRWVHPPVRRRFRRFRRKSRPQHRRRSRRPTCHECHFRHRLKNHQNRLQAGRLPCRPPRTPCRKRRGAFKFLRARTPWLVHPQRRRQSQRPRQRHLPNLNQKPLFPQVGILPLHRRKAPEPVLANNSNRQWTTGKPGLALQIRLPNCRPSLSPPVLRPQHRATRPSRHAWADNCERLLITGWAAFGNSQLSHARIRATGRRRWKIALDNRLSTSCNSALL